MRSRQWSLSQAHESSFPKTSTPISSSPNSTTGRRVSWLANSSRARAVLERAVGWARQENVTLGVLIGMGYLAEAIGMSGDLRGAYELFQTAVRYAHEHGLQEGAVFAKANLGLGHLCYEWNQLESALQYLTHGIRLAEQGGYLDQLLGGYVHLMHVQSLMGNSAAAKESLNCLRRAVEKYEDPPVGLAFFEAARADLALLQGELGVANRWADRYQPQANEENTAFSEYQQVVLAHVLAHRDDTFRMCEMIQPLREVAAGKHRLAASISYDVMAAKCLFMHGEPEPALRMLEHVLSLAEPGQFVRTFLDEGGVVISMIKQLLAARGPNGADKHGSSLEYLHRLLDEAAKDAVKASTGRSTSSGIEGFAHLTEHELRILQLLEAGNTNKQISSELSISLNTVKYHLKNIYGKMGVANRTQASRALRDKA